MLLLAGCSYVNDPACHLTGFGSMAHDYQRCRILSRNGAGNYYISHSILSHLHLGPTEVFVLFSGLSRIDISLPKVMESTIDFSHVSREEDCIWLHSGGWAGTWTLDRKRDSDQIGSRYFAGQYLALDWTYLNQQSLMRVIGCLNILESLRIPYTWGFIYDIYQPYTDEHTSFGGAVSKDEPLLKLLPWHRCVPSTPYEYCRDRSLMSEDGFHPSQSGWQDWFHSLEDWRPKTSHTMI